MTLQIVQDEAADEVLSTNAFALLAGMLLQQQAPVDVAFAGPAKILDRFGTLDPTAISEAPPDEFAELCATEPAVHPYPESMSVLLQALARFIVVNYHGDTAAVWTTAGSGEHLLSRLTLMPGFGRRKAQMFVALLGRQLDVRPSGWEQAAGPFAHEGGFRSVADIHDKESLDKVLNAKSGRRKGDREAGDGRPADGTSAPTQESTGLTNVSTEEPMAPTTEDMTDDDERAARKAARREARQAQRREARQAGAGSGQADTGGDGTDGSVDIADRTGEDGEEGETGEPKRKLTPEERAERKAQKLEKRTARRIAAGKDPEGGGGRGGRRGGGRRRGLDSSGGAQPSDATDEAGAATSAPTSSGTPAEDDS